MKGVVPRLVCSDHGVDRGQQLAHAGDQGDLGQPCVVARSGSRAQEEVQLIISVEAVVAAPLSRTWSAWTSPEDIRCWNYAIDEWCCPRATIDLVVGGKFSYRMEARDGTMGFDYEGTFTRIDQRSLIEFELGDGRKVTVRFVEVGSGTKVTETFEAEDENSAEQQRAGWQSILDNFKNHVEASS